MICRFRPACPVAALTMHEKVRRQLAICWGVIPFLTGEVTSTDRIFSLSAEVALKERLVQNGDTVVITAGVPLGKSGSTNLIKACLLYTSRVEEVLGTERASRFHSHFSRIEFTPKGGEKCHRTFAGDGGFGPDWAPLAAEIAHRGWGPTFICESAGTQAEDALEMKRIYREACGS